MPRGQYLCLFLLIGLSTATLAQVPPSGELTVQLRPNEVMNLTLGSSDSPTKKISVWSIARGNISQSIVASLAGPAGLKGTLSSKFVGTKEAQGAASEESGWQPLSYINGRGREISTITLSAGANSSNNNNPAIPGTPSPNNTNSGSLCDGLPDSIINQLLQSLSIALGRPVTRQEYCSGSLFGGPDPTPTPGGPGATPVPTDPFSSGVSSSVAAILHKDTCKRDKKNQYLVRLDISLEGVDPALFQTGFTIAASFQPVVYSGRMASSIKPISDGKFAPQPLLLMASTGGYFGGEKFSLYRWRSNKSGKPKTLKIVKYAPYKGYIFATGLLSGQLNGGNGVFELSNGQELYSVCFRLVRSRQKANGYPQ